MAEVKANGNGNGDQHGQLTWPKVVAIVVAVIGSVIASVTGMGDRMAKVEVRMDHVDSQLDRHEQKLDQVRSLLLRSLRDQDKD
jgi:uncharacterized membrane-anchored protein YhcB (DUF1043 family)